MKGLFSIERSRRSGGHRWRLVLTAALALVGAAPLAGCRVSQGKSAPTSGVTQPAVPWIVGFYTAGMGQPVSEVPWSKITHLHLCCAAPGPNGTLAENWLTPASYPSIRARARANKVRVIVSIYVGSTGGDWFTNTASDSIDTFVQNVTAYITTNNFDGVDLDWEGKVDILHYNDLITKLRSAMPSKSMSIEVYNPGALVTVAAESHRSLDQVNVMCYDMANGNRYTWHNSALFQSGNARLMTCDCGGWRPQVKDRNRDSGVRLCLGRCHRASGSRRRF